MAMGEITVTSRERMVLAMLNKQPDMVPVAPDISNMVPARLTGKPFWDIYLYQDPPLWKAYIHAMRKYGFDGWLPLYESYGAEEAVDEYTMIVEESPERVVTRRYAPGPDGELRWSDRVAVYQADQTPASKSVDTPGLNVERVPSWYRPIDRDRIPQVEPLEELYFKVKSEMGEDGVVGLSVWIPGPGSPEQIYEYYDNPEEVRRRAREMEEAAVARAEAMCSLKPDFIFIPYSGCFVWNTEESFRDLCLPTLQKVTAIAKKHGIPSQMHSCGPSRRLVEICANETDLSSINPLEMPPMGDCDLAEVKAKFGHRISLMGNLHTIDTMLKGSPDDVEKAAREAIDAAAAGGGFILSTGDQCGRDTPDENLYKLVEVAREYGKY